MSTFVITAAKAEQGKVSVNPDGSLAYAVPARFSGPDTITCTFEGMLVVRALPDAAPVVGPDAATVVAGDTVAIAVLGNDADPEGGALTVTGASADQGTVAVGPDGTLLFSAPITFAGPATITYTVADPAGNASQGTVTVEVMPYNEAPVVRPDTATVMAGDRVAVAVLGNDADPEGGALTVTGASADQGSVAVGLDGTLLYSAPITYSGSATITYTVADPAGNTSEGTVAVEVTPYNKAPVTGPDVATVVAGGSITVAALGNDTDPEGGALTLTGATAEQGSVVVSPDGTLVYTAPAGFSGTATITYTVADPAGKESRGTVAVEVVDLAIVEGEIEGEFVVSSAPGELTVTVVEPAEDAGDYIVKTADLAAGPVNLSPPRITGTAEAGATLTALPGLWAFDDADGPLTLTRQWMRGATPIAGQTGTTYLVGAALDAGQTLGVLETGSTKATRQSESAGVAVPKAAVPTWTPAKLPGLALWVDASDASTVTLSGREVTRLADKSGNGRHALKAAGIPAPSLDGVLSGKPVLRFPSGGILKTAGAALPGLPGMPGVTIIAVTQAHLAEAFKKCVSIRGSLGTSGQYISVQTGLPMMWFGNGNRYWTKPVSGPGIAVARYPQNGTHGSAEWWQSGTKLAATSTSKSTSSVSLPADAYFQFGSDDSLTSEQAEFLLVIGPLSEPDRQKAEGYLAHKWGLAGQLPAAHPYKTNPPA